MTPTVLDYFSYYCELIVHFGLCIKINFKIKLKKQKFACKMSNFRPIILNFTGHPASILS